jgi:hypothetical protein
VMIESRLDGALVIGGGSVSGESEQQHLAGSAEQTDGGADRTDTFYAMRSIGGPKPRGSSRSVSFLTTA